MALTKRIALLLALAPLAACSQPSAPDRQEPAGAERPTPTLETLPAKTDDTPEPAPADPSPTSGVNPSSADPYAGTNDGYPDLAPGTTTADANRTETGARAVLLSWARGIELREFDQSWDMMGDAAKTQIDKPRFNALFAALRDISVAVPSGTMEGAAGSMYYTVPTTITGLTRAGEKRTVSGAIVLRRVNDVPGATPAQLAWRIERVDLTPS